MLSLKTVVDRVEVDRFGTVNVRLRKLTFGNGRLLKHAPHRVSFAPGARLDANASGAIEAGLKSIQSAAPDADQWELVNEWLSAFHTPEVVDAQLEWMARVDEAEKTDTPVSRISEEDYGKTIFPLIGADYLTEAAPEGIVDRMVVARTAILLPDGNVPLPEFQVLPGEIADHPQVLLRYGALAALQRPAIMAETVEAISKGETIFKVLGAQEPEEIEWGRLRKVAYHAHTSAEERRAAEDRVVDAEPASKRKRRARA